VIKEVYILLILTKFQESAGSRSKEDKAMSTLVMKFGGAAVATPEQFAHIANLIIARRAEYSRIVVVVSAMGGTTDQLIQLAKQVHPEPPQREYDMLISVGERISMSLLAMALCLKNQEAVSFTGSQSGIITCQSHSQAHIIDVRPQRIESSLKQGKIVIVAGFQGVSLDKEITTLGRGGSDTSAVALGIALKAPTVEFFKDVPGIFNDDPKQNAYAVCYSHLSYQAALDIVEQGAKILHARAIHLAANNGLPLHVRSFMPSHHNHSGTIIFEKEKKRVEIPLYEG
jgi:aspartate kinase